MCMWRDRVTEKIPIITNIQEKLSRFYFHNFIVTLVQMLLKMWIIIDLFLAKYLGALNSVETFLVGIISAPPLPSSSLWVVLAGLNIMGIFKFLHRTSSICLINDHSSGWMSGVIF